MNISPFLSISSPCDIALQWSKEQLTRAGLRPVQTFDLSAARTSSYDCPCPHHGTEACDCQMVILLVYGDTPEPSTLILHGNRGQTWVSLADGPRQKTDSKLPIEIKQVLQQMPAGNVLTE